MNASLRLLTLGLLAGMATACAAGADGPVPLTPTQQYAFDVRSTPDEVVLTPSVQGVSGAQAEALRGLADRWTESGGDPLIVRAPDGGDPRAVEASAHAAYDALVGFGVPANMIRVERYATRGERAPVVVGFARYEAARLDCSETWSAVDATFDSRPSSNFGCATTANIAAQVANPRDLVRARAETPADAARRQAQMALYRQGQPTGATRSADEQSRVRDAAR